jgi:hypothetical protein
VARISASDLMRSRKREDGERSGEEIEIGGYHFLKVGE